MPIPEHLQELPLASAYDKHDEERTQYWTRGGKVFYRVFDDNAVRGADVESFRFWLNGFARDDRHGYAMGRRLADSHGATFRALNFTYMTDGISVWALGGRLPEVDVASFEVCDDGAYDLRHRGLYAPHGYGKDRHRVYYYDFNGKPNWVRKASPDSFVSLNDGHYGKDAHFVFFGAATIPKAKVAHWHKLGGNRSFYSRDDARVYFTNRLMRDVDYASFEIVVISEEISLQLAKDRYRYYDRDTVVSEDECNTLLEKYGPEAVARRKAQGARRWARMNAHGIHPFPEPHEVFADPVARYARHFLPLCSIDLACIDPAWSGRIHMVQPIEPVDGLIGERTTAHHGEWLRTNWVGFFLREGRYHWAGDWKYLQLEDPDHITQDWEREELLGKYEDAPGCLAAAREHYRQHRQLYVPNFREGNVREAGTLRLLRKRTEIRGFLTDAGPQPLLRCLGGRAPSGNWDRDGDCKEWPLVADGHVSEGSGRFLPLTPDGRRFHFIASVEPALYGVDAGCDTLLFYDPVLSVALFTYDYS